ncbi:PIG-L family deacetylase [Kiloniella laminariae]|uniref:PIG-L family deacetylase n=1 Tax=Kiloniella laminariae TaxID=454162 RepID=A0ABT4LIH9_9PROT|nr:PIG-L family deacetylase [Kiloniella laminariae]MCZ4280909.1 PIG-L family deacetylase [Kiloniella laminariae]
MLHVFLFSHQDDEFGVFKVIEDLKDNLENAHFIYLTSGTFDGNLSASRNKESLNVLSKFGITSEQVHFIGGQQQIADGQLYKNISAAENTLHHLFKKIGVPNTLYIHAWEGGHQDHDAAHLLGLALATRYNCLKNTFQFSLYNGYALPWIFYRVLTPISHNGEIIKIRISWKERWRYLKHCCSYPSQLKTWIGLFPFTLCHYLFDGHQKLQPCSLEPIIKAPHEGTLLYEARKVTSYGEFSEKTTGFIQKLVKESKEQ